MIYVLAILIGVVAGLRAITPIAALAIGGALGWIYLEGTTFAFLLSPVALWLFVAIAAGEIVNDKLPRTPSRTVPMLGGARMRALLARSYGQDGPAALTEDAIAIVAALLIVYLA